MSEKKPISPNNPNQTENQWGRPQKFTPETLREKAFEYFALCEHPDNWIDKWIGWRFPRPKTLSWLCIYLWVSKDYISEKLKDDRFSETIKEIRLVVENNIEEWILYWHLASTAWIFNLKNNFWWVDKQEVDNTNTNLDVTSDLSEEQKKLIAKRYAK